MSLIQATSASIHWDNKKGRWTVSIAIGAEVIRRAAEQTLPHDATDEALRALAVDTARAEGYELNPSEVGIERRPA